MTWKEARWFRNERNPMFPLSSAGSSAMDLAPHQQKRTCSDWFCINWEGERKKKREKAAGTLPPSMTNQSSQQWWIREQDSKFYRYMKPHEYKDTFKTLPFSSNTEGWSQPWSQAGQYVTLYFSLPFLIYIYMKQNRIHNSLTLSPTEDLCFILSIHFHK